MMEIKKFPLISGYLSLDLVNTELVRRGQRHDLLIVEEDVIDWLKEMQKTTPVIDEELIIKAEERKTDVLSAVKEFRLFLRENFEAIADEHPISNEYTSFLENKIGQAPFAYKLIQNKLIPRPIGKVEDIILSHVAFDALNLIVNRKMHKLKRCTNPECVLLFIDESGRRKWCAMQICGNRTKVARFQDKQSKK
ncbi:RNA-binding protein [Domibacillus antri]|uniref:RNA-binding protein n=1 Tax=Domibacillus antri TaxID=1714264 RepID=A0A1Q8Q2B6_9BACI|nr:CGNR zinc finger domain-containing protein [Domibacillus antri]OLN21489.1 RNA-binding protein [Domibacillus antri]